METVLVSVGSSLLSALSHNHLVAGGGEGRRLLRSGAISVNGEKVMKDRPLCEADFVDGVVEVRIGRAKKVRIQKGE